MKHNISYLFIAAVNLAAAVFMTISLVIGKDVRPELTGWWYVTAMCNYASALINIAVFMLLKKREKENEK